MKMTLKEIRKARGLTQRQIADRLDVTESQVSRWETGRDAVPGSRIAEVARAYECGIGEMFGEAPVAPKVDPRPSGHIPPEVAESVLQWVYRRLDLPEGEADLLARASVIVMQQSAQSAESAATPDLIRARVEMAFGMLHPTTRQ